MQIGRWTTRGRPRGRSHSAVDTKLLEYLVKMSVKQRIDPERLFDKIVEAWNNQKSSCKHLTIQCREKMRDRAIFLIISDQNVVAQFPVPEHLLEESAPLKELAYLVEHEENAFVKKRNESQGRDFKIKDLKIGMKRVNLKAHVLTISRPQLALTKYNDYARFTNVTLEDETGTMKLTLWKDRMGSLSTNDLVEIKRANVTAYRGETQLRIGRHSELRVIENHEKAITRELEHAPDLQ